MTEKDDFDRQMDAARKAMDKYAVALSVFAQGANLPHMTDDIRARLEGAKEKVRKYRGSERR